MKKYKFLNQREGCNKDNTILHVDNKDLIRNAIVVRDWTNKDDINYYIYQDGESIMNDIANRKQLHEICLSDRPRKPKYDIDGASQEQYNSIIETIQGAYVQYFKDIDSDHIPIYRVFESKNLLVPEQDKLYAHIIFTNLCFANFNDEKRFNQEYIYPGLSNDELTVLDKLDKANQSFRIIGTTNDKGRTLVIPDRLYPPSGLVTWFIPQVHYYDMPTYDKDNNQVVNHNVVLKFTIDELKRMLSAIDQQSFQYSRTEGNLVTFRRLRRSHCRICNRAHDSDNMYLIVSDNYVRQICRREDPAKGIIIYNNIEGDFVEAGEQPIALRFNSFDKIQMNYNGKKFLDTPPHIISRIIANELSPFIKITCQGAISIAIIKFDDDNMSTQSEASFYNSMSRKYILVKQDGKVQRMTFERIIMDNIDLFQVSRPVFVPGVEITTHFNLWFGWKAKQCEINYNLIQPILDHIKTVWANNDEVAYNWILDWFKAILQGKKTGTCLVLYSEVHGVGKNIIADWFRDKVIGTDYAISCGDIEGLVSKFNAAYKNKVFTIIDEMNTAGTTQNYHRIFDILKNLIVNNKIIIEQKGVNSQPEPDFNNYLITSNNERPIKIEQYDRRYTVLKCTSKKPSGEYFNNLLKYTKGEFSTNAANSFLSYLLDRNPVSDIHQAYDTIFKQNIIDLWKHEDPFISFIKQTNYQQDEIPTLQLYQDFLVFIKNCGINKDFSKQQFIAHMRNKNIFMEIIEKRIMVQGIRTCVNTAIINPIYLFIDHQ